MGKQYDDNNIFAKILRGELPCHKVHEDEHTLVFMDIMPRGKGHALVIPKAHVRNIIDAPDHVIAQVHQMAKKIALAGMSAFKADGVTIQQFNETAGGQVVFHLHVHVIPRFDGVALNPHTGQMADPAELEINCQKLKAALQAN